MSVPVAAALIATDPAPRCTLGEPKFDERYRAIDARDTRFDGQFYTAVSSTGIYCRPSCPARTPKPENVAFYLTSAAAHEAGFRACKRCLPEAVPGSPEWDLRGDLVGRAMRLIVDGTVDREGVAGLADRLGYTTRHVHRLLADELGASPLALARARRAQSARALLADTQLSAAQIAFASGFGSVRQFNDTMQAVYDSSPGELRASPRTASPEWRPGQATLSHVTPSAEARVQLELALPVRQPFDAPGIFAFLAARAISGVEVAALSDDCRLRYARTLLLPHGAAALEVAASRDSGGPWSVRLRLELADVADVGPAVARVRRMLDLDADPASIDAALTSDAALAPLVERTPGIRVPGAVDGHELVVRAIVGQQISVKAARSHLGRLAEFVGTPYDSNIAGLDRLFPSPTQISSGLREVLPDELVDPERPLRLPGKAINAVIETSRALATGELQVHIGADPAAMRAALVSRPRIGPWTAAYIAMRVLGDPDAWLEGDVALISGARSLGMLSGPQSTSASHRQLAKHAQRWAPWRSYASMHLWQAASTATAAPRTARSRQDPT